MNITKKKLAQNISVQANISLEDSQNLVNNFFFGKSQTKVLKTHNIKITRFGSFYKKITPKNWKKS